MAKPVAPRVLVVDDDVGLLEVIETILEPLGVAVTTAASGARALRLLADQAYDLVISDLVMPGVDGHDLIAALRSRGDTTPVLYLSGSGKVPDVVKLMRQGAVGFLEKPFEPSDLKREVLAALGARRASPPAPRRAREEISLATRDLLIGVDASIPSRIGRYTILGLVAEGGMGKVFRAHDPNLDRDVALKVLHTTLSDHERAQFAPRFRREAQALAKLRHPHIVQVYDAGVDDTGVAFVVMELLSGASLTTVVRGGQLPIPRALAIAGQLARALAYAHHHGIVHRDVKPDNVIVEPGDVARLIDFGIARVERSELTHSDGVIGSPNYLSPEQANAETVDYRADQFALATVILEMLSGQRVFRGSNIMLTARNVSDQPAPTLAELGVDAPPELQYLLTRMHAKDPAGRIQDDDELIALLAEQCA